MHWLAFVSPCDFLSLYCFLHNPAGIPLFPSPPCLFDKGEPTVMDPGALKAQTAFLNAQQYFEIYLTWAADRQGPRIQSWAHAAMHYIQATALVRNIYSYLMP